MKNLTIKSTIQIRLDEGVKNLPTHQQVIIRLKSKPFEEKYGFHLVEVYKVKEDQQGENTDVLFSTYPPTHYELHLVCDQPKGQEAGQKIPNDVGDGLMHFMAIILPENLRMPLVFQHDKIPVRKVKAAPMVEEEIEPSWIPGPLPSTELIEVPLRTGFVSEDFILKFSNDLLTTVLTNLPK